MYAYIHIYICNVFVMIMIATTVYTDKRNIQEHLPIISKQPTANSVVSTDPLLVKQNPYKLEVGSIVEHRDLGEYGVIKWIGELPGEEKRLYAGVEMVSYSVL